MNIEEINEQREQLWNEYNEGHIDDNELYSTLDILDEDELRCRPPEPPQPLTANEKVSVLKLYIEALVAITIVLFFVLTLRSCELSNLENEYAELQEEYEEAYRSGYNDGYDDGYNDGYYDGDDNGFDEGYDEGYNEGRDADAYEEGYDDGYRAGKRVKKN